MKKSTWVLPHTSRFDYQPGRLTHARLCSGSWRLQFWTCFRNINGDSVSGCLNTISGHQFPSSQLISMFDLSGQNGYSRKPFEGWRGVGEEYLKFAFRIHNRISIYPRNLESGWVVFICFQMLLFCSIKDGLFFSSSKNWKLILILVKSKICLA